jgi:hypothetical protein
MQISRFFTPSSRGFVAPSIVVTERREAFFPSEPRFPGKTPQVKIESLEIRNFLTAQTLFATSLGAGTFSVLRVAT